MPRKPRHLLCGIVIELGTRNCVLEALVSLNLCVCAWAKWTRTVVLQLAAPSHCIFSGRGLPSCLWVSQLTGQCCASSVFLLAVA